MYWGEICRCPLFFREGLLSVWPLCYAGNTPPCPGLAWSNSSPPVHVHLCSSFIRPAATYSVTLTWLAAWDPISHFMDSRRRVSMENRLFTPESKIWLLTT